MKRIITIAFILVFGSSSAADYFWVGGTGNWSDNASHWATTSGGGLFHLLPPSTLDNVIFDVNSFSVAGETVTLDVDGNTLDLSVSGLAVTANFAGASARKLTVGGDVALSSDMSFSGMTGTIELTGTKIGVLHTMNAGGADLSSVDLLVNLTLVTDRYELLTSDLSVDEFQLQSGVFGLGLQQISVLSIDANFLGDVTRELDFNNKIFTVRGVGATDLIDFESGAGALTLSNTSGAGEIDFTGSGQVVIKLGDNALTLPRLDFVGSTDIDITTGASDPNTTMTFDEIRVVSSGTLDIDSGVEGLRKVYGAVNLGDGVTFNFDHPGGASFGDGLSSRFDNTFEVGNLYNGSVSGAFLEFGGVVTLGLVGEVEFNDEVQFESKLNIGRSNGNFVEFKSGADFIGLVDFYRPSNGSTVILSGNVSFGGGVNTVASSIINIENNGSPVVSSAGDWTLGENTNLRIGIGTQGDWTFSGEVDFSNNAILSINNLLGTTILTDLDFNGTTNRINSSSDLSINGTVDFATGNSTVIRPFGTTVAIEAQGDWTLNGTSVVDAGFNAISTFDFTSGTVELLGTSKFLANTRGATFEFNNLTLGVGTTIELQSAGIVNVNGALSSTGTSCVSGATLKSRTASQVRLQLSGVNNVVGLAVEKIRVLAGSLVVTGGADVGENEGNISFTNAGASLFWVGGMTTNTKLGTLSTGVNDSWSNPDNWSAVSGVYSGTNICIPDLTTAVTLDAASFDGGSTVVDVNVDGFTEDITMSNNDNGFTITGAADRKLTFAGDVDFDNQANFTGFDGSIELTGQKAGPSHTFNTRGRNLSTLDLIVNLSDVTDTYVSDNTIIAEALRVESGIINLNGFQLTTDELDVNSTTDAIRGIDFNNNTRVLITGNGSSPVVDFTSAGGNVTLSNVTGTAEIESNAGGQVVMHFGDKDLSVPNLELRVATNIDFETKSSADNSQTISFREIRFTNNTGRTFDIDRGDIGLRKTYESIIILRNCTFLMEHPGGAALSGLNSEVSGTVTVGNNSRGTITGDEFEISGAVLLGNNADTDFDDKVKFGSTLTMGTNTRVNLFDESTFVGDVSLTGNGQMMLSSTTLFQSAINIADGSNIDFINNPSNKPTVTIVGDFNTGVNSDLDIGNDDPGIWDFQANTIFGSQSTLFMDNDNDGPTFNVLTLDGRNNIRFPNGVTTTITSLVSNSGCTNGETVLRTIANGATATLDLAAAENELFLDIRDITITGAGSLTVDRGNDRSNNTNITFNDLISLNLYWVGGTAAAVTANKGGTFSTGNNNNWNNPDNWAQNETVYSGSNNCIPTIQDDVFFKDSSFVSATAAILSSDGSARNIDFTGVNATTPSFTANLVTRNLNVGGNFTWDTQMATNYNGTMTLRGNVTQGGPFTVDMLGDSIGYRLRLNTEVNQPIIEYDFLSSVLVSSSINIESGIADFNNNMVACNNFDANEGNKRREIKFGTSTVNIYGGDIYTTGDEPIFFDLRDGINAATDSVFVTASAGSVINFLSTEPDIMVHLGNSTKTVPDIRFVGATDEAMIFTARRDNCVGGTITIGNIEVLKDGVELHIDNNDSYGGTTGQRGSRKIIDGITLPNNNKLVLFTPYQTSCGATLSSFAHGTQSVVNGFTVGDNLEAIHRGAYFEVTGTSTFGENTEFNFNAEIEFNNADITVASTTGNNFSFKNEVEYNSGTLTLGNSIVEYFNPGGFDNVVVQNGKTAVLKATNNQTRTITGNVTINKNANLTIGDGTSTYIVGGDVVVEEGATLHTDNNNRPFTFNGEVTLKANSSFDMSADGMNIFNDTLRATGSCTSFITIQSNKPGNRAQTRFSKVTDLVGVVALSLDNRDGASQVLTITDGSNAGNNAGVGSSIIFGAGSGTGATYFWIGGIDGVGGDNNLWSDPANWGPATGTAFGAPACVPGLSDNVVFDALSFDGSLHAGDNGAESIEIDINSVSANNITFENIDDAIIFDDTTNSLTSTFTVLGNLRLNSLMTNEYEGKFEFLNRLNDIGNAKTVDPAGVDFFGPVEFDSRDRSHWILQDDLNINGGERGDLIIGFGRLLPSGNNINVEDDILFAETVAGLNVAGDASAQPTFNLTFDGKDNNPSTQRLAIRRDDMSRINIGNIVINRESNTRGDSSKVEFDRNFDNSVEIMDGFDGNITLNVGMMSMKEDFILRGDGGATQFTMADGTLMEVLGEDGGGFNNSGFPEGFGSYSLHPNSTVIYNKVLNDNNTKSSDQLVSGNVTYGNIELFSDEPGTKRANGPVSLNGSLLILEKSTFDDGGFQITANDDGLGGDSLYIDQDGQITIGATGANTSFPTGFDKYFLSIQNGGEAIVRYNGNGAQNIDTLDGNTAIPRLILQNDGDKTLLGDIDIYYDLSIDDNSTLVHSTVGDTIRFLTGRNNRTEFDLDATASYTPGGTIILNGINHDLNDRSNTLTVKHFEVNATGGNLRLYSNLRISDTLKLTDGVIATQSSGDTVFITTTAVDAIVGASTISYVRGSLSRAITNNNDTVCYPIGRTTNTSGYHRACIINHELDGLSAIVGSVVSVTEGGNQTDPRFENNAALYYANHSDSILLNRIVSEAIWTFDPVGTKTGGKYSMQLFVNGLTELNGKDNSFTIVKRPSSSNDYGDFNFGTTSSSYRSFPDLDQPGRVYNGGNGWAQRDSFETFSDFAIAISKDNEPLPIELLDFSAIVLDDGVNISWITATETNNDYFVLEKSTDLSNWDLVSEVDGAGNSVEVLSYSTTDIKPSGIVYYRLKQVDFDGKFTYSNIISVNNEIEVANAGQIILYPNPASGEKVNIVLSQFTPESDVEITVSTMNGVTISAISGITDVNGAVSFELDDSEVLLSGAYVVTAKTTSNVSRVKLIIE